MRPPLALAVAPALAAAATLVAVRGLVSGAARARSRVVRGRRDETDREVARRRARPGIGRSGPVVLARSTVAVAGGVAAAAVVVWGPWLAVGVGVGIAVGRAAAVRSADRRRRRRLDAAMPELVDLLVIAAAAGHPVDRCVTSVASRAPEPLRVALLDVVEHRARGAPLAVGLQRAVPALGTLGPPLVAALIDAQRGGSPLAPALRAVAATARDQRRRDAEEAARRLPVTLLLPLVGCVLPAFALLAVVPLLAGSLSALQL